MNDCQNCKEIQSCDKIGARSTFCSEFKQFGETPEKPTKSKNLCINCRNNYYNDNKKNGCWNYKDAKVTLRPYPNSLNQKPPFKLKWILSCFSRKW